MLERQDSAFAKGGRAAGFRVAARKSRPVGGTYLRTPMVSLYVTEPGATVRQQGDALVVTSAETTRSTGSQRRPRLVRDAPVASAADAAEGGRIHCGPPKGADVGAAPSAGTGGVAGPRAYHFGGGALLSGPGHYGGLVHGGGSFRGRMTPAMPRSADLRLLQYAAYQDTAARLARAATRWPPN